MRHLTRTGIAAALGAGALLLGGTAAAAEPAPAVSPSQATISFDCGSYGSGSATLDAAQDGTSATITVTTSAVQTPIIIAANTVKSTLVLSDGKGGTKTFSGSSNPTENPGKPISTGPLTGTVAAGDQLSAQSLTINVLGQTGNCKATSDQNPGPFQF